MKVEIMSTMEFTFDVSAYSPERRRARAIRLLCLTAQRPGHLGDTARAALGAFNRRNLEAQAAAVEAPAPVEPKSEAKPATKPVRHDYVDDKSIASGYDLRGTEGHCEEK